MSSFGDKIKEARSEKKISQEELANMVNTRFDTKLNKGMISKWENNKEEPRLSNIQYISEVLEVPMDFILGIDYDGQTSSDNLTEIYNVDNIEEELLSNFKLLPTSGKDKVLRNLYKVMAEYSIPAESQATSIENVIESLIDSEDLVIHELAMSSKATLEEEGAVRSPAMQHILKQAKHYFDSNRMGTAEFMNFKRDVYEELLPLKYFDWGYDLGYTKLEDLSKHFNLSIEFIVDAIKYYINAKGVIVKDDDYIIDFSNIDFNKLPIEQKETEIKVTDTNLERISKRENDNKKKKWFRK